MCTIWVVIFGESIVLGWVWVLSATKKFKCQLWIAVSKTNEKPHKHAWRTLQTCVGVVAVCRFRIVLGTLWSAVFFLGGGAASRGGEKHEEIWHAHTSESTRVRGLEPVFWSHNAPGRFAQHKNRILQPGQCERCCVTGGGLNKS